MTVKLIIAVSSCLVTALFSHDSYDSYNSYDRYLNEYQKWKDRELLLEYWLHKRHDNRMEIDVLHNKYKDKAAVRIHTVDGRDVFWAPPPNTFRRFDTVKRMDEWLSKLTPMSRAFSFRKKADDSHDLVRAMKDYENYDSTENSEEENEEKESLTISHTRKSEEESKESAEISRYAPFSNSAWKTQLPSLSSKLPGIEDSKTEDDLLPPIKSFHLRSSSEVIGRQSTKIKSRLSSHSKTSFRPPNNQNLFSLQPRISTIVDEDVSSEEDFEEIPHKEDVTRPNSPARSGYREQMTTKSSSNRRTGNHLVPSFMYEDIWRRMGDISKRIVRSSAE